MSQSVTGEPNKPTRAQGTSGLVRRVALLMVSGLILFLSLWASSLEFNA